MTPEQRAFIKAAVALLQAKKRPDFILRIGEMDAAYRAIGPDGVKALLEEKTCDGCVHGDSYDQEEPCTSCSRVSRRDMYRAAKFSKDGKTCKWKLNVNGKSWETGCGWVTPKAPILDYPCRHCSGKVEVVR